jgi:hypothetical protein
VTISRFTYADSTSTADGSSCSETPSAPSNRLIHQDRTEQRLCVKSTGKKHIRARAGGFALAFLVRSAEFLRRPFHFTHFPHTESSPMSPRHIASSHDTPGPSTTRPYSQLLVATVDTSLHPVTNTSVYNCRRQSRRLGWLIQICPYVDMLALTSVSGVGCSHLRAVRRFYVI